MSSTGCDEREGCQTEPTDTVDPATDTVDELTRSLRRLRAAQLDEIHVAVEAKGWVPARVPVTDRLADGHQP